MYKLMIVDDEPLVIKAIEHIIKNNFPEVKVVANTGNGLNAVKLAKKTKPDIIMMDIKLDGLNGIESTSEIKKFLPEAIIIIISAYDNFNYAQQAIKLNVLDYLLKPVIKSDITNIINKAITNIEKNNREKMERLILKEKLSDTINNTYSFQPPWKLEKELLNAFDTYEPKQIKLNHEKLFKYIHEKASLSEAKQYYQELIAVIIRFTYKKIPKEDKTKTILLQKYYKNLQEACSFTELEQIFLENLYSMLRLNKSVTSSNINPLIIKAQKYIENNYKNEITLENIAEHISIAPTYLSKLFKDTFNTTIVDYITKIRLSQAIELLKETNLNIKTIAKEVGYHDPNYFSKVFKKSTGKSPSNYRGNFLS